VIGSAEVRLHHVGDPLRLDIVVSGSPPIVLGSDLSIGQRPQVVVPSDAWQAATPLAKGACRVHARELHGRPTVPL